MSIYNIGVTPIFSTYNSLGNDMVSTAMRTQSALIQMIPTPVSVDLDLQMFLQHLIDCLVKKILFAYCTSLCSLQLFPMCSGRRCIEAINECASKTLNDCSENALCEDLDNVTGPSQAARKLNINTFSIGVTDHVLASELESIAGSPNRWFYVDKFKERSCIPNQPSSCDVRKREKCLPHNEFYTCQCDRTERRHPVTGICC
uniref:EGF_CA domain-containing protein n=1 Tax=Heterorhabditis bacteriophora TaxID=37862 RepID=A0A1I7XAU4_HETBA